MQSSFDHTLNDIILQVGGPQRRIAIAYSGGLDSAVLLNLCIDYAQRHATQFIAFHIHHGISSNANQWVDHCQQQCAKLNLLFEAAYIQLTNTKEQGVEAAARNQRYKALGELCQRHQIDILLTGHHQDDQAETMLLQLLRGTGVAGLCGMQQCHRAGGLLQNDHVLLARPLLDCTRAELESYVAEHNISHIEDESNVDLRYSRNALRHQIMPLLAQHFPGYQTRFARTAHHAESALNLLEQLAQQDYERCRIESKLDVRQLQTLPESRIDNVLRYWLAAHQIKMPSTARLAEMRKQLLHAKDDAQVSIKHSDIELYRYRDQIGWTHYLQQPWSDEAEHQQRAHPAINVHTFQWQGETSLSFPTFGGTLFFDPAGPDQPGIDRTWLLEQQLQIRPRQGGERLKLALNRPTRSIKSHYQTMGIPYWQRERLPFVFVGEALLFAAGVGMNGEYLAIGGKVTLRWE